MTGPEHYRAAEELLQELAVDQYGTEDTVTMLATAQVHATLALAAATALAVPYEGTEPQIESWARVGAW